MGKFIKTKGKMSLNGIQKRFEALNNRDDNGFKKKNKSEVLNKRKNA